MTYRITLFLVLLTLPFQVLHAQNDRDKQFNKIIEGAEKIEGFFDLYRTSNKLYMAVKADQIGEEFILNYQIAKGVGSRGLYGGQIGRASCRERVWMAEGASHV